MKTRTLRAVLFPILFLSFLVMGCQSQKPAFSNSPQPAAATAPSPGTKESSPPSAPPQTVAKPEQKLAYDSTKILFKVKRKSEVETYTNPDIDDNDEEEVTSAKLTQIEKYKKREKEKGNWLSGGFLAAGMALLLTSLVLLIIGSGPAGLLAIIGGSLFLLGFIFTMVALLGR